MSFQKSFHWLSEILLKIGYSLNSERWYGLSLKVEDKIQRLKNCGILKTYLNADEKKTKQNTVSNWPNIFKVIN